MPLNEPAFPLPPDGHRWEISSQPTELGTSWAVCVRLLQCWSGGDDDEVISAVVDINDNPASSIEIVGLAMNSLLNRVEARKKYSTVLTALQDAARKVCQCGRVGHDK